MEEREAGRWTLQAVARLLAGALVAAGLASVVASGAAQAGPATSAYAVQSDGDDRLYRIDLTTGTATAIGTGTGFPDIEGLAFDAAGTLYGVDDVNEQLVRINTTTGVGTLVGPLNVVVTDVGLAFDCAGNLWMSTDLPGTFYRVDTTTGAASPVGPQGQPVTGLTALGNTGYGLGGDETDNLVTIDTATGEATVVGPLGGTLTVTDGGLDFDDAGVLWGLEDQGQIFTINRTTGTATLGATTLTGFEGMAISGPAGCLSVADVTVTEGGTATFTVTLSTSTGGPVTVQYATVDGSAAAPGDYAATSGTLNFGAGQTSRTITVPVVEDCATDPGEAFTLVLSNPTGGAAISDASATATITDRDCPPPVDPCVWEPPGQSDRPVGDARPGYGRGDDNHCHAGPPGRA